MPSVELELIVEVDEPILIWVHGTPVRGGTRYRETKASVVVGSDEPIETAVARGAIYLLDSLEEPTNYLTNVWFESVDSWDFDRPDPLMDGQIPGRLSEGSQR